MNGFTVDDEIVSRAHAEPPDWQIADAAFLAVMAGPAEGRVPAIHVLQVVHKDVDGTETRACPSFALNSLLQVG
jgi:hypothetical protein